MDTPDAAPQPPWLPIEADALPVLDDLVIEAICQEHHRSILQFAERMLSFKWSSEQIVHVAAEWPWDMLARAVAAERIKHGQEVVPPALLDKLRAEY